jgi:general secretion pathway protein A
LICKEFGLDFLELDEAALTDRLHQFLLQQYAANIQVVLIIDEAQNLAPKTLEKLRLLSNLEDTKHHLIQMILVGQPELKFKLQRKDLEQFAQRVAVHCHLDGLKREEVDNYIRFRLKVAGAKNLDIFDPDAIEAISNYSRNIPRLINNLCDTALVYGYGDGLKIIDKKTIDNVISQRQVGGIYTINSQDEKQAISTSSKDSVIEGDLENRSRFLEKRIALLEDMIGSGKKLDSITENMDKRYSLFIELIKLLKSNMESRLSLQQKLMLLNKNIKNDNTKKQSNTTRRKPDGWDRLLMRDR